ncbi:MAG: hypothetical protein QM767_22265 [Anaeromyxobacter sp.]
MDVDELRVAGALALGPHLHRSAGPRGIEAESDGLADQGGLDLVDVAIETDGPVAGDLALLLLEEEVVDVGAQVADLVGERRPAVEWRRAIEAAVRGAWWYSPSTKAQSLRFRASRPWRSAGWRSGRSCIRTVRNQRSIFPLASGW